MDKEPVAKQIIGHNGEFIITIVLSEHRLKKLPNDLLLLPSINDSMPLIIEVSTYSK